MIVSAFDPDHGAFMHLARQNAGLKQFVSGIEVEVIGWHHAADWRVHIGLDDFVDHGKLIAQLAVGAGLIQYFECVFPKTAAHRKNGVILREELNIVGTMADGGARQVARDFAQVGLHHFFYRSLGLGLFGQDYLANHCVHIGIRQLHAHCEAPLKLLQVGCASDGSLPRANEEHLGTDILRTGFDRFLHIDGALTVFTDVLLHLVNDYQCQWEFAVAGKRLLDGFDHVAA